MLVVYLQLVSLCYNEVLLSLCDILLDCGAKRHQFETNVLGDSRLNVILLHLSYGDEISFIAIFAIVIFTIYSK